MPNSVSSMYWNDLMQSCQPLQSTFIYKITGAKTCADQLGSPTLVAYDAIASQAVINSFLGTTDEFLLAAFDSTSMGADAFAILVNLNGVVDGNGAALGQCKELICARAKCYSGTAGATIVEQYVDASTALTGSSLSTQAAKGAYGNVAVRVAFGNTPDFDALTDGMIEITLYWKSK